MDRLNYHHLRYFREVAHEGNLTRAAERLNVSQSALSTQIKALEDRFGHALFDRANRQMRLTEAGRIVLDHADRIFAAGEELALTLANHTATRRPLKVGSISTLSRNFQLRFLRPVLEDCDLVLSSGASDILLTQLQALALDVVLTTEPPRRSEQSDLVAHRLAEQPVSLFGVPSRMGYDSLSDLLRAEPVILPTESSIRTGFDSLVERLDLTVHVLAEVDDMAMVRLLARAGAGLAIVPEIVVADELAQGVLQRAPFPLAISETFYAITARRRFQHPLVHVLLSADFD